MAGERRKIIIHTNRYLRLFVCAWLAVVGVVSIASAQQGERKGVSLTLTSKPVGCTVYLDGDFSLVTTAPNSLVEDFRGAYRVTAVRDGYETYHASLVFSGGQPQVHNIVLSPRTRIKSGVRSLVLPGWGQYYSGEGTRSAFWAIASLAAGAAGVVYELRYRDRKDDLDNAWFEFDRAQTIPDRERWAGEIESANRRAYDAESDRVTAWSVLGGVWAANVLDAVIFFPDHRKYAEAPLSISATSIQESPAILIGYRF